MHGVKVSFYMPLFDIDDREEYNCVLVNLLRNRVRQDCYSCLQSMGKRSIHIHV